MKSQMTSLCVANILRYYDLLLFKQLTFRLASILYNMHCRNCLFLQGQQGQNPKYTKISAVMCTIVCICSHINLHSFEKFNGDNRPQMLKFDAKKPLKVQHLVQSLDPK